MRTAQGEAVLLLGSVGVVALDFRGLEFGPAHVVGESLAGGGIGEPVGVAVHQGDIVLTVRLCVLFVNVADDVASFVNGLVAQSQVLRDAHPVVNLYIAGLGGPGAPGCAPVVVLNDRNPGKSGVQPGHDVAGDAPVFQDHVLGPGDAPVSPQFRGDGIAHLVPKFGVGVIRRFVRLPDFHYRVGVAVHRVHPAFAAFVDIRTWHDGVAVFVLEAASG